MKTKREQRHKETPGEGKGVSYKAPPREDKPTSGGSAHVRNKPLAGKVFYLDLPSNRITDALEMNVKELGGTVEKFFSKEIKYLVSNKREARYMRCLRQNSSVPDLGQSSPQPCSDMHQDSSNRDTVKKRCLDQTDTLVRSRGKTLLEKVVKGQSVQLYKILSNALKWGVKILYIDDVLAYLANKKKKKVGVETKGQKGPKKCKGGQVRKHCVKVEDSSRHYRPIYFTLSNMPQINLRTLPPRSPFLVADKPGNKRRGHRIIKASESDERARGRKNNRDKKGGGYCECCAVKYESLSKHLKSDCHRTFSKSNKYLVLDKLISNMRCDFIHLKKALQRCSVSSVVSPGRCVKSDLQSADTNYEQKAAPSPSGPAARGRPRRCDTLSDGTRRQLCRHKSLISRSGKASLPKTQTAPPSGDCLGSLPHRVKNVDVADQITTENTNSSTSDLHNAETNQRDDPQHKRDFSVFSAVRDGNMQQDKITGATCIEKQEGSVSTQDSSPVRTIQRRVHVYERKRRKLATHVECLPAENSRLKLLEMFQSSEDAEVEFLGFES